MTEGDPRGGAEDLYATLGVPAGATDEEITRAYRRLARQRHPDTNPEAEGQAFSGLTDAYDVLRDPGRRRAYDDTRQSRAHAARRAAGVRIPVRYAGPAASEHARARTDPHMAVPPEEFELALSFDQAALGTTATIPVQREVTCPDCGGTGVARSDAACGACAGAGSTVRTPGGISIRTECGACRGTGRPPPEPCRSCRGSGSTPVRRDITVRVPPGVDNGTRVRVRVPDEPALELVAVVSVAAHPYFARHGDDITMRLPVTLAEAALGAVVTVPTLDSAVAIRIPAGTPHGRTLRVRGRGIAGSRRGDLLVTVEVVVPTELTDAQRAALEAFASATGSPRGHFERSSATDAGRRAGP